ncbi:MAG: glycosyltransferase [Selenomonadaceae bacterium]|nr:glycosyltransferase [Selenomonadaceae bacterium]
METCAISVVVPMYNAEKYIGALLESLLAQTFKNFEVIIVDDCSTDSSCSVVESYKPKFGGRLRLSHMKKNSGGPGAPTNKAIAHAGGKYIFQADNDDLLTKNALEQFYAVAEKFQADVVHAARYIFFTDDPKNPFPDRKKFFVTKSSIDKTFLDSDDIGERIKLFCRNTTVPVEGWLKFVRRDFLVENEIILQEDVKASQDIMWTIELLCYAKRYLHIPQPLYICRQRKNSVSHAKRQGAEGVEYWGKLLVKGAEYLCNFFGKHEFFQTNPQYGWLLLDWLNQLYLMHLSRSLLEVAPHDVQKILAKLFADDFGKHADLIAYLCTSNNFSRLKEKISLKKIQKLTARVAELEQRLKNFSP